MPTKQMKTLTPAQYAFVRWLYQTHPKLAHAAEEKHASLSGFMDTLTNVFDNVVKAAPDLLKKYQAGETDIAQLRINLARAKAGQYPLDASGAPYNAQAFAMPKPSESIFPMLAVAGAAGLLVYLMIKR